MNRRWANTATWWILGSAAALAPWCEQRALGSLSRSLAQGSEAFAVDIDLHGLRLRNLALRSRRAAVSLAAATISYDSRLRIELEGVDALAWPTDDRPSVDLSRAFESSSLPSPDERRWKPPIPIHVLARGRVHAQVRGLSVTAHDPRAELTPHGDYRLHLHGQLQHSFGPPVHFGDVVLAGTLDDPHSVTIAGTLSFSSRDRVPFAGHRTPLGWSGRLGSAERSLAVVRALGTSDRARIVATNFDLAWFSPLVSSRVPELDLREAAIDGTVSLEIGSVARLHTQGIDISGLRIADPRISADPIEVDVLRLGGDVVGKSSTWAIDLQAELNGIRTELHSTLDPAAFRGRIALREISCQSLLDKLPRPLVGVLAGTQLSGRVGGRLSWSIDRQALARARDSEPSSTPLGELSNDLDILESCPTERDAPATDFIALKGPYRHHFEDDLSRSRMRVLARGAPGFVRLAEVPDLGRAFVTLEDARFWEHEGFDAAQIERAVWHNLSAGRFERGASTITQQTARNLWLGLDRSLGRKLQEAFLADRLERVLSKERILEIYLNVIQLGPGIYGVEEAARYYFGKPAAQLSLLQCVHIASLAPAPNRYAERFASGEVDSAWLAELHNQLRRMFIHGWITRSRLNEALRSDLALRATAAAESSRR